MSTDTDVDPDATSTADADASAQSDSSPLSLSLDAARAIARGEFAALSAYVRGTHSEGFGQFLILLLTVWLLGVALISLVVALPRAVLATLTGTGISGGTGRIPLTIGFLGTTVLTAAVGYFAYREPQSQTATPSPDRSTRSGSGSSRSTSTITGGGYAVRIVAAVAGTVLSVSDRLVSYLNRSRVSRSRADYGLVLLGVWIGSMVGVWLLTALLWLPLRFLWGMSSLPVLIGLGVGSILFGWMWWRARGERYQHQSQPQQPASPGDPHPPSQPSQHPQQPPHGGDSTVNQSGQPSAEQPSQSAETVRFVSEPPAMDFSDVVGMEALKKELRSTIIEPFHGNDIYAKYGVGSDSGILFHGPPGTGKTYLANCLAGELEMNYLSANVGDLDSAHLGEGVQNIIQLFDEAWANQPSLVFIDELDAIGSDRGADNQHHDSRKMVNQLLQELSAIDPLDDILVIGATNHSESIDSALLRTGRFDAKIEIPPPDADAREAIFQHHLDAPSEAIDSEAFRRATHGMVASDMEMLARRAALAAAQREQETGREGVVRQEEVFNAIEGITDQQETIGEFVQRPPDKTFADVAGMADLKETLRRVVSDPLMNPAAHEEYGLGIENGILLYGPPGTGKTHIATSLAGELEITYIEAKAGDLVSQWVGQGAQNVQQMFEEARAAQPCLVFIDEIDALATDRSSGRQTKSERQMVNQFLEELSQLSDEDEQVVVIGATNRPDDIDAAMLRTGRFTKKIEVPPPDAEARVAIGQLHLTAPHEKLDWAAVAAQTEGFVASDMKAVAQYAARSALERASDAKIDADMDTDSNSIEAVTQADMTEAIEAVR
jgi:transitional endoplasmic reticulum ATPase